MVPAFVAGPASRKTRAAPGFNPFRISAAAIGVKVFLEEIIRDKRRNNPGNYNSDNQPEDNIV
jgi:hypothetical protein